MVKRKTRKTLEAENKMLLNQLASMKVMLRAYIQSNKKLQDDIDVLNASLNAAAADMERWRSIAHKADERRREYVRSVSSAD